MGTFKKIVRKTKKASRFIKKVNKHPVTKGIANIAKIAQMVKLLNVEKKRVDINYNLQNFSQFNGAGIDGSIALNLTPVIPQGVTNSTRNGNSLKLVSACLDLQFTQQLNCINNTNIRYFVFIKPDNGIDIVPVNAESQFLEPNPFSLVRDYHAPRNPEFFQAYRIIKTGTLRLEADQLAAQNVYKQIKVPLKLKHHLKYDTDASTITTKNKFFISFHLDQGDTIALTGTTVSLNMRYYYVDN